MISKMLEQNVHIQPNGSPKQVSRREMLLTLGVCAASIISGCGGAHNNQSGVSNNQTVTTQDRKAALDALDEAIRNLSASAGAEISALGIFFKNRSDFIYVQSEGNKYIQASFKDGLKIVVLNNPVSSLSFSDTKTILHSSRASELPSTESSVSFDVIRNSGGYDTEQILLQNGYSIAVDTYQATLDNLRNIQNCGVFFMSTHGGGSPFGIATESIYDPAIGSVGLLTDDDVENGRVAIYKNLFYNNSAGEMLKDGLNPYHFLITSEFVKKYMNFSANSLVYINACSSYRDDFKEAFWSKGANLYVGWTNEVNTQDAKNSAVFVMSHLIGSNNSSENPLMPINVDKTWQELNQLGLDRSSVNGEVAVIEHDWNPFSESQFAQLAPSIVNVSEAGSTFTLFGVFGSISSQVTVGGSPATIVSWTSTQIICQTPKVGGDTIVVVGNRKSNVVTILGQIFAAFEASAPIYTNSGDEYSLTPSTGTDDSVFGTDFNQTWNASGKSGNVSYKIEAANNQLTINLQSSLHTENLKPATPPSDNYFGDYYSAEHDLAIGRLNLYLQTDQPINIKMEFDVSLSAYMTVQDNSGKWDIEDFVSTNILMLSTSDRILNWSPSSGSSGVFQKSLKFQRVISLVLTSSANGSVNGSLNLIRPINDSTKLPYKYVVSMPEITNAWFAANPETDGSHLSWPDSTMTCSCLFGNHGYSDVDNQGNISIAVSN